MMLIETFCYVWNTKETEEQERLKELGVSVENEVNETLCPFAFKLQELSGFRPEIDEGNISTRSIIYMKSGESFVINMDYQTLLKTVKGNQ